MLVLGVVPTAPGPSQASSRFTCGTPASAGNCPLLLLAMQGLSMILQWYRCSTTLQYSTAVAQSSPAVHLPVPEAAPPGKDPKDEDDSGGEEADPAHRHAHEGKDVGILRNDGACREMQQRGLCTKEPCAGGG